MDSNVLPASLAIMRLVDDNGHVVGIVVLKLNAITIVKVTGDIPQTVNFEIKTIAVLSFLESEKEYSISGQTKKMYIVPLIS